MHLMFLLAYLGASITIQHKLFLAEGLFLLVLVGQSLPKASRANLIVSAVLFTLGAACLFFIGATPEQWQDSFIYNGGLVALFIALPLFSFILHYDRFQEDIAKLFRIFIRTSSGFSILTAWLSFLLGAILNLAGLHVLYGLLKENAREYGEKEQFYRALARGILAGVFWAPTYMALAVVLHYVNLPWIAVAPGGVIISIFVMALCSLLFVFGGGRERPAPGADGQEVFTWQRVWKLSGIYAGLIVIVALFNIFTKYKILTIVPLIALFYPAALAMLFGKADIFRQQWGKYWQVSLLKLQNEVLLFSSVGFFARSLDISGVGAVFINSLNLQGIGHPSLSVFLVILVMALVSVVGVHPIVSISAIAVSLNAASLGLSPLAYTYMLLLGYAVSVLASPFSAITMVMSGLTGEKPWQVVPRQNIGYLVLLTLLFSLILPHL